MTYLFCFSLGLWIVMLSASNVWGHSPGPVFLWQPPQWSQRSHCGWTDTCGTYYDHRHMSATTIEDFAKTRFITCRPQRGHGILSHTARLQGERVWAWASVFLGMEGGGPRVLQFTFHWRILNIRTGIKLREGQRRAIRAVSHAGHRGLSGRGTSQRGQPGSLSSCLARNTLV